MVSKAEISINRLHWVDQTKGLAILAIVLFHFFQNYPERINLINFLDRNGARLGYAGVDIFFVLAGFNTSYVFASIFNNSDRMHEKIDWRVWLKKRLYRLYPTYLLAVFSSIVIYNLFGDFHIKYPGYFVLSCLGLAGLDFQVINPGFWFFFVILQAYLVTPLIFYICKSNPKKILVLGIVVGVFTKIACFAVREYPNLYEFLLQDNFLGSYFFELCLGMYWGFMYASNQGLRKVDLKVATSTFIAGIIVYITMAIAKIDIIYMLGFDMAFTPFFFILAYLLFLNLSRLRITENILKIFSIIGLYSYQIYLIHQPIYISCLRFLNKTFFGYNSYVKILLFMVIIIVILSGYIVVFIKLDNFLRKLLSKALNKPR